MTKTRSPRLSARAVATLPPGLHGDTANLLLCVKPSGSRSWIFRYQLNRRRHDLGLGPVDLVSLKQARQKALDLRRRILAGEDPAGQRRTERRASGATFESCAAALIAAKAPEWTDKQRADWESTLRRHAFPTLGRLPVGSIDTADVLTCLQPIWTTRTTTAARLRARIEATLDYAGAMGARTGENPARWRGHLSKLLAQPRKVAPVVHHAALPWQEASAFMAELRPVPGITASALAFTILCAVRASETLNARWSEFDVAGKSWVIPKERTKTSRPHRVALSDAAVEILIPLRAGRDADDLVFTLNGRAMRSRVMLGLLNRMRPGITVHGFRACFKTWASEATAHPREVIEAALAHRLGDAAEQAYARGDLLGKRRRLMEDWAEFLTRAGTTVTDFPTRLQPDDRQRAG